MSQLEKRAFPLIFAISLIAYVMSIVMRNRDFGQHWLIREDGGLESLTAICLLTAAILSGLRCWSLRNCRPKRFLICTATLAVALVFGMGEEISWGQRILGVQSPDFFLEHNAQNETNLHNLVAGSTSINKLVFGKLLAVGLVLYLLLPVWYHRSASIRRLVDSLAVPLPRVHQSLAIVAVALLVETSGASKRGEIMEFALSSLALLVLINPENIAIFRRGAHAKRLAASTAADRIILPAVPREPLPSELAAGERRRDAA